MTNPIIYSAGSVPRRVKARGGAVIDINPEPSADGTADIRLPLGSQKTLRELDRIMRSIAPAAGGER